MQILKSTKSRKELFCFVFTVIPLVFGTILPFIKIGHTLRIANLPWGLIFGLGVYGTSFFYLAFRPLMSIAAIGWPALICLFLFRWSRHVWLNSSRSALYIYASLLFFSLCVDIPLEMARIGKDTYLPLYAIILSGAD